MVQDVKRYYYLDSMRSTLMLLGVVLHSSKIYDVVHNWDIDDTQTSLFFDWLAKAIHLFRMPAFFIIAGFFALFSLEKYGVRRFLRMRVQRLLVPLAATALLLNSVQDYLRHRYYLYDDMSVWYYMRHDLPHDWARGDWVVHLWFLNNLIIYCLIATFIYEVRGAWRGLAGPCGRATLTLLRRSGWLLPLLALVPVALRVPAYTWSFCSWRFLGITSLNEMLEYLPYFLFGMWYYRDPELQAIFCRVRWWHWGTLAVALAGVWWWADDAQGLGRKIAFNYSHGLLVWLSCLFCFTLFRRLANRPSALFFYLSDASYTVYLFHHLFVVVLGLWLLHYHFSVFLKFCVVFGVTLAVTLAIHHYLILQVGLLRLLFNGKPLEPAPPAARVPAAPVLAHSEASH